MRVIKVSKEDRPTWLLELPQNAKLLARLSLSLSLYKTSKNSYLIYSRQDKDVGEIALDSVFYELDNQFLDSAKFKIPHITLNKKYRGKGIAKEAYSCLLDLGWTFITNSHSKGASRLWDSLDSFESFYVDSQGMKTEKSTKDPVFRLLRKT
jgi:predicted GNAT family acetyltransferase